MEAINLQKTKNILKRKSLYIGLAIAYIIMMFVFPNETKFKYEYQRGRPWMYETLIAPIDFPILKTEAEIRAEQEELASVVVPYYVYDNSIYTTAISDFAKMQTVQDLPRGVEKIIENSINKIYKNGILPDEKYATIKSASASEYIVIQKNRRATEELLGSIYTVEKSIKYIKSELLAQYPLLNADSILMKIQINNYLVPNLVIDKVSTEAMHKEAVNYISPSKGMIYAGQLIVTEGETITAEIEQLLNSYKAEYELSLGSNGDIFQLFFAHAIITLIVLSLLFFNIYFVNVEVLKQLNKFSFFLVVALMNFCITVFARGIDPKLLYMVPYAVFALYMISFSSSRMAFPLYIVALIPLLIITEHGIELFVMNAFAGGVALVAFSFLNRGWHQFLNALIIFISLLLVYVAFRLLENINIEALDYNILLYLFLNALFVVAAYPLVFLLEKIFGLVSGSTLKDLADTNNTLLQELARKAPGTFQHSLQVANLAARAVTAIGGDYLLVRVGAMYHDIGKISNPQCFIENAAPGVNYHAGLSPMESAQEIIKHVEDGVEIAKKHNLPQIVIDFITSHHAKSQTMYFYNQYCNQGGDPEKIDEFTYNGTYPTSKEQVVVMMADAVEAASRSLKDYSAESISNLVDSITKQRLTEDSQLVQADISIKDINIVRAVFKKHLQEIYHARIAYPKRNK
ncbi:MAG: HDIG domain-containing protein [Bacteroidales bacterium]|nr:HDIG domain-containing protein [Bacteroidales bacterium]